MDYPLADLTATDLVRAYQRRELSPVEVLSDVHGRIDTAEPTVAAFYLRFDTEARAAAAESERRWAAGEPQGPIDGVPITLKENIATRGVPIPLGTAATELRPAHDDAPAAARVREAGAVILGKTTMPDMGMLSSGLSSLHRTTTNPWDAQWNPGGSSAGAAAACAAGYGPLHLGTDIGGSVRLPAGWTATVGHKPSFGRVPVDPPYWGRVIGPITRTVADTALLMSVVARFDPRDYTALPPTDIDWSAPSAEVRGLRIALQLDAGCGMPVEPEVEAAVRAAADIFALAGAEVTPIDSYLTPVDLDEIDRYWRVRNWDWFSGLTPEAAARVLPYIAEWSRAGAEVGSLDLMRCTHRMLEVARKTCAATECFDLVLSPVSPGPTFPAEHPSPTNDVRHPLDHIGFTMPYNFSGQPAISVHCGWTGDGKPIGLQIIGRRFADLPVLSAATWYESARAESPAWPPPAVAALS